MSALIDIRSKAPYPANALGNFAPHAFDLDGVACRSMESFLQSLKIEDPEKQESLCNYKAGKAQGIGRLYKWQWRGTLWWRGAAIDRLSDAYQALLDRAYDALFAQSRTFRDALAATGEAQLTHSLGKDDPSRTILTSEEFCARLERLRARLKE